MRLRSVRRPRAVAAATPARATAPRRSAIALALAVLAAVTTLVLGPDTPAAAANPAPVMTGYVPLNADQFQAGLKGIGGVNIGAELTYTVGITNAGAGAILTYDHWEDGYEADLATPAQATTLVFGDENPANGDASTWCAVCTGDRLPPGAPLVMNNKVTTPRTVTPIRFDGGDKVASTRGFTITAGGFPTSPGSVIAGVVSSYDTTLYSTAYTVPVGPNSPTKNDQTPFDYTAVLVQAAQADTTVEVDTDANGTYENVAVIGEGETRLVKVTAAGAKVRSSAPVQVHLATGDPTATYESRWLTLFADSDLSDDYMSPAAGPLTSPTENFVFNPNATPIVVTPSSGAAATIPANGTAIFPSPVGTALRLRSTGGKPFIAVAAIGALHATNSSTWDWGATLVPTSRLTSQVVIGWAPGNSNNPPTPAQATYNPVWLSASNATVVYVDYDGNPATGAVEAAEDHCMGSRYDAARTVAALASERFSNTATGTMSGARLYTCDGTPIAAAWGEDPSTATTGAPGFDAGYTVIPTTTLLLDKTAVVTEDVNEDGKFSPGDRITYEIAVSNAGNVPFSTVTVKDPLRAGVTYVPGSSVVDNGTTVTPIADDGPAAATAYPFDETGRVVSQITSGQRVTVRFDVEIDNPYQASSRLLDNTVCVEARESGSTPNVATTCDAVSYPMPVADLELTKVETANPTHLGDDAVFRVRVENKGPDAATGVVVADQLPEGLAFKSATPTQGTYVAATGRWAVGTLAPGAAATLTVTARVEALTTRNFAQVIEANAVDPDSQPAENPLNAATPPDQDDEDDVIVTVAPAVDLSLTKTVNRAPGANGTTGFQVTITNDGPIAATNVVFTDHAPLGAVFVSSGTPPDTEVLGLVPFTARIPTLAAGASRTFSLLYRLASFPTSNTAEIMSVDQHDMDSTPGNGVTTEDDQDTVAVTRAVADLSVTKTASATDVGLGDTVTYTVTVANAGPDAASGVTVTDKLPAGLTHPSAVPSTGTYDPATGVWTIGAVAKDATATLTITARVAHSAPIVNRASVTASDQYDPDSTPGNDLPEDDDARVTVTGRGAAIGDRVWLDTDGDGVQDAGETGLAGVTVQLYRETPAGPVLAGTIVTGADGYYRFVELLPGDYEVRVLTPTGSGLAATTPVVHPVTLTPGQTYLLADSGFRPEADLSVTKAVMTRPTRIGDAAEFLITVRNAGPATATGVVVTDLLPAGLAFDRSLPSIGSYDPATGAWTVGSLASGSAATLTVHARATAAGTITNTAEVTASDLPDPDSTPGNHDPDEDDQDEVSVTVGAVIDLELEKTVVDPPTYLGDDVTFQIKVTNQGPSTATDVEVTDAIPAGFTLRPGQDWNGRYDPATGLWTIPSLAANTSTTLVVRGTMAALSVTNRAEVTAAAEYDRDSTPDNAEPTEDDEDEITVTVAPKIDLSLTKTLTDTPTHVGDTATFTVVVANAGPSPATGVTVRDELPAGLTLGSATATAGSYDAATGIWTIGTLGAGSTATLTVTATVTTSASITNVAQVATAGEHDPDSTPGNDRSGEDDQDDATVQVRDRADLSLTKTLTTAPTYIGDRATYTIVVTNAGPSAATGVTVGEPLGAGLAFVASSAPDDYDPVTGEWTVGRLAPGASATLTVTATVTALTASNTAQVTHSDQDDPDSTPGNDVPTEDDQKTVTVTVAPKIDLSLAKTVATAPVHLGDEATFAVTVRNDGPSPATGVQVTDRLPAGLTYVRDDGTDAYDPTTGIWTVGTVAAGGSRTLRITVTVDVLSAVNRAQVTAATEHDPDSQPGENPLDGDHPPDQDDEDLAAVTVAPLIDLALTKSSTPATVKQNGQAMFTITVTNAGPSPATGVVVGDRLPAGVQYLRHTGGTYDPATGEWTIGTLAVDGTATLEIVVTVTGTGPITNRAQVLEANEDDRDSTPGNADDPGHRPEDDEDATTLSAEPIIDLSVLKSVAAASAPVGGTATFTVTVNNAGPSPATGVVVTDRLPAGLTHVSDDPSQGRFDPATGDWTVGTLPVGATATLTLVTRVTAPGAIVNWAEVTQADQEDADSAPAEDPLDDDHSPNQDDEDLAIVTGVQIDLALTTAVDRDRVNVGETVAYTVTLTNEGFSPATGVVVDGALPPGLTYVSADGAGSYDPATGRWDVGTLEPGGTVTVTIVATVTAGGPITAVAQVHAANEPDVDSTPANGVATEDDQDVVSLTGLLADLSLTKTASTATPDALGTVTYTLTLRNDGPTAATNVVVLDRLPAGLVHASDTSAGAYDPATGRWTIPALGADETTTIDITATVVSPAPVANSAQVVASDQPDPDSTPDNDDPDEDDQASVTVTPRTASLGGTLWLDRDRDGTQDPGEPPLGGVTVTLFDDHGDLVASTTTAPDGSYRFDGLLPGTYTVRIDRSTLPDTIEGQTYDKDLILDDAYRVTLVVGDAVQDVDFGYAPVTPAPPVTPGPPVAPTPPVAPSPGGIGSLPRTGTAVGGLVLLGLALLAAGRLTLRTARRRPAR